MRYLPSLGLMALRVAPIDDLNTDKLQPCDAAEILDYSGTRSRIQNADPGAIFFIVVSRR